MAGIAHNSSNPKLKNLYYQINRDLTIQVAKKAKQDGANQFIFMSSMIVFGNSSNGKTKITNDTIPNPDSFYGDSKLQAEKILRTLESDDFRVVILRPPMIYGKGSKGNYPLLSKLAQRTPVFPDFDNKRSMLYIENLCEFLKLLIENNAEGTFHPQNSELVKTSKMVKLITEHYNHKIWFTKLANPLISLLFRFNIIKKVFGDLYYDESMSKYKYGDYQIINLKDSIKGAENNET